MLSPHSGPFNQPSLKHNRPTSVVSTFIYVATSILVVYSSHYCSSDSVRHTCTAFGLKPAFIVTRQTVGLSRRQPGSLPCGEAGFYSDTIECWPVTQTARIRSPRSLEWCLELIFLFSALIRNDVNCTFFSHKSR